MSLPSAVHIAAVAAPAKTSSCPALAERQRRAFLESRLLLVDGLLESVDGVQHLIAENLQDLSPLLRGLDSRSRDFH